jgi:vacuolar protein sorting-associated protein 1
MQQGAANLFGAKVDKRKPRYSGPFINEIRKRLDSYFMIVLKNVRDTVPKTIGYFLVRQLQVRSGYTESSRLYYLVQIMCHVPAGQASV